MAVVLEHEGKRYVALRLYVPDEVDGFNVFLREIDSETVADWQEKVRIFTGLAHETEATSVTFTDYGEYRAGDEDADLLDVNADVMQPDWTQDPERTECDHLEVCVTGLSWEAIVKHTDLHVTTDTISPSELEELARICSEPMATKSPSPTPSTT